MRFALISVVTLALLFLVFTNVPMVLGEETSNQPPAQALYLHTEFYPSAEVPHEDDTDLIVRELIRQALLIAAREELHVPTYDETLGETSPKNIEVLHLFLRERQMKEGPWKVTLYAYNEQTKEKSEEPIWEKEYPFDENRANLYADMAEKLNISVTQDLVQALQASGLRNEQPSREAGALVEPNQLDEMLREVDFVKQFAAVRSAHQSIAITGESPEQLSVLVRGYANMSMLSWHQYNATTYAYIARAWLYAERLKSLSKENNISLWNSAYAWALGGGLNHALADLRHIGDPMQSSPGAENAPPNWMKLIDPYCKSNREATKQVGELNEDLKPWATRLWFEITRTYLHTDWTYHAGSETIETSPTAYGVYATMAAYGAGLRTGRSGAYQAPIAFGQHAPHSLDAVPGMPKLIRDFLPTSAFKQSLLSGVYKDPDTEDSFSGAMAFIAKLLRNEDEKASSSDLSWSALAYFLEEEMFIQIVNFLSVSTNATESSQADEVAAVMPFIKDHRYASYIAMMRYNWRHEVEQIKQTVRAIEIVDARRSMVYMGYRLWDFKDENGKEIGKTAMNQATLCFTVKGILVHYFFLPTNWKSLNMEISNRSVETLSEIAPHSEIAVRFELHTNKDPSTQQLDAWQQELSEDATAFSKLGDSYLKKGDIEKAAACFAKSAAMLPMSATSTKLANIYWETDFDKWEKPLLDFLTSEDSGLAHSRVHRQLALGYQHYGLWEQSKPHALAAGQTWSATGLQLASENCEALAEWQESEYWVRERSEKYPSYSGEKWYFWCRRTGRGNELDAQAVAQKYFEGEFRRPTRWNYISKGAYHILEQDLPSALQAYQKSQSIKAVFTCSFMIAQLSRQLGNEEARTQVLADIEKAAEDPDHFGKEVTEVGLAIVELLKTGDDSPEKIGRIEKLLENYDKEVTRSAFAYFVGAELEALENQEEAEKYWRRAMNLPDRDRVYATLSGSKLAERYGTSRPDNRPLDVSDLWPTRKIADLKQK